MHWAVLRGWCMVCVGRGSCAGLRVAGSPFPLPPPPPIHLPLIPPPLTPCIPCSSLAPHFPLPHLSLCLSLCCPQQLRAQEPRTPGSCPSYPLAGGSPTGRGTLATPPFSMGSGLASTPLPARWSCYLGAYPPFLLLPPPHPTPLASSLLAPQPSPPPDLPLVHVVLNGPLSRYRPLLPPLSDPATLVDLPFIPIPMCTQPPPSHPRTLPLPAALRPCVACA